MYLLNSDAFIDPGALKTLVGFMEDHPKAGFAGSQLRGEDGAPHTTHFRFPSIAGELEQAAKLGVISRLFPGAVIPMPPSDVPVRADWTAGASLLIRSTALEEVGLFDERFFLYYEETDLCLRAHNADWQTWFVPQSTVVHVGSVSTGMKHWARTPSYWFASRRHYFRKNHGQAYAVCADLARLFGGLLWRARRVVSPRPLGEPAYFLRDFLRHSLRASRTARPTHGQYVKDSK